MNQNLPTEQPNDFTIKSIKTIGKDGITYTFRVEQITPYLRFPYNKPAHCFRIRTHESSDDWFEFDVLENADELKVIAMSHNYNSDYIGKGIPEVMIRSIYNWLNKKVISSSNLEKFNDVAEFRSEMAEAVWHRLIKTNEASYDDNRDIFIFPNQNSLIKK